MHLPGASVANSQIRVKDTSGEEARDLDGYDLEGPTLLQPSLVA